MITVHFIDIKVIQITIFDFSHLWAARGSRSGADWERLGSVPNLKIIWSDSNILHIFKSDFSQILLVFEPHLNVLGIIGVSKGGLTRDSGILDMGRVGGIPPKMKKNFRKMKIRL